MLKFHVNSHSYVIILFHLYIKIVIKLILILSMLFVVIMGRIIAFVILKILLRHLSLHHTGLMLFMMINLQII